MLKIGRRARAAALLVLSGFALISTQAQAQLGLGSLIVTMASPASGSIVSDTVPVSASVSVIGLITVRGVQFKLDGANLGAEVTSSPYSVSWNTTTTGNGSHTLTAVARDLLGVQYTSDPVTVTVSNAPPPPPQDTTPPSVPTGLTASAVSSSQINLSWAASSDNVGVSGYRVYRGGTQIATTSVTSFTDTGLSASTTYTYAVAAFDAAGNLSAQSSPASATTPAPSDTTPPTVSITSPADGATVNGTVTVSANASDNVGVAGVQFLLDGTNLGAESTTAPYSTSWNTTAAANGSHTLTAVARDAAGNHSAPSAPVTVTVANGAPPPPPPPGSTTRFQETDPSVAYSAGWTQDGTRSWSGGTATVSATPGAQATFTFTGPSVSWIGGRATFTGIARISLDGVFLTEVDTYSKTEEIRVPMFAATGLGNTSHTLTIEVTGRQNAAATGALLIVDAFDVPAATVSRLQETDPSITYTAGTVGAPDWMPFNTSRAWSAGIATLSTTPGAQATISFTGTGISWLGAFGPQTGKARVTLDGVVFPLIDTYSPTEKIQAEVFTQQGLADTSHTLTVEVTGEQNANSTSPLIVVDGFEVTMSGTRHQDTDQAIAYGPNWFQDNRDKAYSEGASAESNIVGAQATITFTGTGIRWIGARGPQCGIARIFLDGAFVEDFDTYFQTEGPQHTDFFSTDFFRSGLAPGTHTLSIQVIGKNPVSTDFWILIDAFDVIP